MTRFTKLARPKYGSMGGAWQVKAAVVPELNPADVRKAERLTQAAFAKRYGFSASMLRDWEQCRKEPTPAARALLAVIAAEPEAVRRALGCE